MDKRVDSGVARVHHPASEPGQPSGNEELPSGGFVLGGPGSGLFTMILDEQGNQIGPGARVPGIPSELAALFVSLLEKDIAKRPPSAAAVAAILEAIAP